MYESHPIFDIESKWDRNFECPVSLADFQKRLDAITGLTVEGRSRLKVVWGMAPDDMVFTCETWMRRHPHLRYIKTHERINPASGLTECRDELIEIGVPRFYVMELHDVAELRAGNRWEEARYVWDGLTKIDVLGPCPEDGFYMDLFLIAHHDKYCCDGKGHVKGTRCLGAYRPPGEADLKRIRRIIWNRNNATPEQMNMTTEQLVEKARKVAKEADEKFSRETYERLIDAMKPHVHAWTTDDPSVISNGKYHHVPASYSIEKE